MSKDLLTDLSNRVVKLMKEKKTSSRSDDYGIPRQPDGSVDYDAFIPEVFTHLNNSLKRKHFYTDNDNWSKSNAEAANFREEGNKCRVGRSTDHDRLAKALESYAKSIAHAIPGSQEVALAYANRSAVLLHLNHPEECLVEINRALELGYPDKLKPELLIRRGECCSTLAAESLTESKNWKLSKSSVAAKETTKKSWSDEKLEEIAIALNDENVIPPIKTSSKKFPCASDAVDVDISTLNGRPYRRLVATRDIDVGEVLIVEKPYFNWVLPDKRYAYCSYCLDFAWECVPCDTCKNVVYCSETCRAAAWTGYHEIECPLYGLLIQYSSPQVASHGVRLFVQLCIEAGGLKQLKRRVEEFNNYTSEDPLRISHEWYQKCSLERILSLSTNERDLLSNDPKFIRETVQLATCTLFLIASRTNLLGRQCESLDEFESLMNDQDTLFFAKLLVKLSLIAAGNIVVFTEIDEEELNTKGFIISPFERIQNHSCCSNTVLQYKKDHVVFHSIAFIEKGEEITSFYCQPWYLVSRQDRHNFLRAGSHFFSCSCQACEEDWPILTEIISLKLDNFTCQKKIHPSKSKEAATMFHFLERNANKVFDRQLEDKVGLMQYFMTLVWYIYENNCVPCYELGIVQSLMIKLYTLTGNSSHQLKKSLTKQ